MVMPLRRRSSLCRAMLSSTAFVVLGACGGGDDAAYEVQGAAEEVMVDSTDAAGGGFEAAIDTVASPAQGAPRQAPPPPTDYLPKETKKPTKGRP